MIGDAHNKARPFASARPRGARSRGLRVLSVAYPFAPVTVDPAGGTEQVLAQIDRALLGAGHSSCVIAPEESVVTGELVTVRKVEGEISDAKRPAIHAEVRDKIAHTVRSQGADIIHLHGLDFHEYVPPAGLPVLVTLHLPLDWYPPEALRPRRPDTWLHPVSNDQARRAPDGVSLLPPIGNGVDVDVYRPGEKEGYALVLGRVAPEKGFHHALEAARIAGVPCRAAGKLFPYLAHHRHFEEEVAPRLDELRTWIGPVEGAVKRRLIAKASCLLIPSTVPETSSLVAMEALASGTPVIAFRAGALPEIVDHGVTGFIVDTVAEMADAIGRVPAIDPYACRRAACERFPLRRTTRAYLDLYSRLVT